MENNAPTKLDTMMKAVSQYGVATVLVFVLIFTIVIPAFRQLMPDVSNMVSRMEVVTKTLEEITTTLADIQRCQLTMLQTIERIASLR